LQKQGAPPLAISFVAEAPRLPHKRGKIEFSPTHRFWVSRVAEARLPLERETPPNPPSRGEKQGESVSPFLRGERGVVTALIGVQAQQ